IATLFGFWIASVSVITYISSSNKGAFINTFLYMFGMTISYYVLKYISGFFIEKFNNEGEFQTNLFLIYSALSLACGIGSFVLYYWNKNNKFSSILYALPVGAMLAEGIGCWFVLINRHMLLAQTVFDSSFALLFGIVFFKKTDNRVLYFATVFVVTALVFFVVYKPFLLSV
ncbi:MAG: hypothetical protein ACI4HM_08070, partial [Ruminococcus sp.]